MNHVSFCHICFEGNRTLKDLLKAEEECLELMAKLRVCVHEVDWSSNVKLLVCDKCIKKLNKAHEFKKQCIQSSETLKLYISELKKTKEKQVEKKEEPLVLQYLNLMKDDKSIKKPPPFLKPISDQQVYPAITKIILTNQSNSFQNVFLNLLPQTAQPQQREKESSKGPLYKLQIAHKDTKKTDHIAKLLTATKTEEVSVEIDPLDFNMGQTEKVDVKPVQMANNNFRPILPKLPEKCENYDYTNEEKMEFFNSGHFLLQDIEKSNRFFCDKCLVRFESTTSLHAHYAQVHSSQYPYKCEYCGTDFASKEMYRTHMNNHCNETSDLLNNSITLNDFTNNSPKINELLTAVVKPESPQPPGGDPQQQTAIRFIEVEAKCDQCDRVFASAQGLARHKAKLHKDYYTKKKYFVKGMKNAKCDICNRMFSTQSYMNLHRKLHERKGEWRRKIYRQQDRAENRIEEVDLYDNSESDEEDSLDNKRLDNSSGDLTEDPLEPKRMAKTDLKCAYCSAIVRNEADLQWHTDKIHLRASQYKCQYCDLVFDVGSQLTKHLLTHMLVKCSICKDVCSSPTHLRTHIAARHGEPCGGKCCICKMAFDNVDELEEHVPEHTGVYMCHVCRQLFNKCVDLTIHLVEHSPSTKGATAMAAPPPIVKMEIVPINQ